MNATTPDIAFKEALKNSLFSVKLKCKKKYLPFFLTPLITACGGVIVVTPTQPNGPHVPDADWSARVDDNRFKAPSHDDYTQQGTPDNDAIFGANGDDTLSGLAGEDRLYGYAGNDTLRGGDGDDILRGGSGNDELYGDAGDDEIFGESGNDDIRLGTGDDYVNAGDGNDFITAGLDGIRDEIDGGAGVDGLTYRDYTISSLTVNLNNTHSIIDNVQGDRISNIENIEGSLVAQNNLIGDGNDNEIWGGNLADFLGGNDGDDILNGLNGADDLDGGAGNDTLNGGDGNDELLGRSGNDTINGGNGEDQINGGTGNDTLTGGADEDTFIIDNASVADASSQTRITDFAINDDFINLADLNFLNNFTDVQNNMTQDGDDTLIVLDSADNHQLILDDVIATNLNASDFIFV